MRQGSMSEQRATPWHFSIDRALPCWEDYEEALNKLVAWKNSGSDLPDLSALQSLISPVVNNLQGEAIQFVSPTLIPGSAYEEQIFTSGQVSTRKNNWHDFFNALVWWRFPALKSAMNAVHFREIQGQPGTDRSRLRDALTLWDESGVIVASANNEVLEKLTQRDWRSVFQDLAGLWQHEIRVFVCGHALLEKFLKPYKAITAHALLVQLDPGSFAQDRASLLVQLENRLASELLDGSLLTTPADLSPLPLAGIPGWWHGSTQDRDFYADGQVFRKPATGNTPAPVVKLALN